MDAFTKITVTKDQLDKIVSESQVGFTNPVGTLTHCTITLPCEFILTGESACVDPANYSKALGEKYSLEDATKKLWELEGYLLANDIHREKQMLQAITNLSPLDRMLSEYKELSVKLSDLRNFRYSGKGKPDFVSSEQWRLLDVQAGEMAAYAQTLNRRIELMEQEFQAKADWRE